MEAIGAILIVIGLVLVIVTYTKSTDAVVKAILS